MNQFTDIAKQLKNTFDPYINVDIKLWDSFAAKLQLRKFKKNEIIKDADQTEHYINFIAGKGSETCISLCVANSFSSDYYSFLNQKPSIIYSRALETSELFSLTHKDLSELYSRSTMGIWIGKAIAEQLFIQRQQIQIDLLTLTAEERYLKLLSEKPEIFQRVSLKHIASYIGVTAESLSRLRKNISL